MTHDLSWTSLLDVLALALVLDHLDIGLLLLVVLPLSAALLVAGLVTITITFSLLPVLGLDTTFSSNVLSSWLLTWLDRFNDLRLSLTLIFLHELELEEEETELDPEDLEHDEDLDDLEATATRFRGYELLVQGTFSCYLLLLRTRWLALT